MLSGILKQFRETSQFSASALPFFFFFVLQIVKYLAMQFLETSYGLLEEL